MADSLNLDDAFNQLDSALGAQSKIPDLSGVDPCALWKQVRPAVVDLIAALKAIGGLIPWAGRAAQILDTLEKLLDALCGSSQADAPSDNSAVDDALRRFDEALQGAGLPAAAAAAGASPCDTWQSARPGVLSVIAALQAAGILLPLAKRAAVVLQTLANLLDTLCQTSSGSAACGVPATPTANQPTVRKVARYGWMPDLPDARDHLYAAPAAVLVSLPSSVDLRPQCPKEVYDQGQLGSCTANGIAGAIEFDQIKQGIKPTFTSSRLFIYYNERVMLGDDYVHQDSGAQIRDGVKSVATQGAPPESSWPYNISQFTVQPSQHVYQEALQHRIKSYQRLAQTLSQMKGCLAAGFPFVFGFTVYDSFESAAAAKTGTIPMPNIGKEKVLGGHCMLAVGYSDAQQRFLFRNSWGPNWGNKGYGTIPYQYLMDNSLSDDFWTIRMV